MIPSLPGCSDIFGIPAATVAPSIIVTLIVFGGAAAAAASCRMLKFTEKRGRAQVRGSTLKAEKEKLAVAPNQ